MTSEGFGGDVNGDFVDKHASKFPLMSMVGKAIPSIVRTWGVRTPIGMSVNMSSLSIFLHGFQAKKLSLIQKEFLEKIIDSTTYTQYQAKSSIYKKCAPVRRGRRLQEGIEGVGGVNSLDFI